MKILIIGSEGDLGSNGAAILARFCEQLGKEVRASSHQILLCSEQKSSADYQVLKGMVGAPGQLGGDRVIVHRPDDPTIRASWEALEVDLQLQHQLNYSSHLGPTFRAPDGSVASIEGLRLSFLLCQLAALKESDAVVAVGGRTDGAAAVLLAIAREQRKPILPFRFLGGEAERIYNQIEGELRVRLDYDAEKLSHADRGAASILNLLNRIESPKGVSRDKASPRIFLSYSWRRGDHADLVEAILRRRQNVFLFRDETGIRSGESITAKINLELEKQCNVFLSLWSREYVESPQCFDEMHLWQKRDHNLERFYLLRFDDTRPVWPILRKTERDLSDFDRNWPMIDLTKGRAVIEKVLIDFIDRMMTG